MSKNTEQLLLDAATRLCRARRWLRVNPNRGPEYAAQITNEVRLMLESVEMTLGREAAIREEMLQEGTR